MLGKTSCCHLGSSHQRLIAKAVVLGIGLFLPFCTRRLPGDQELTAKAPDAEAMVNSIASRNAMPPVGEKSHSPAFWATYDWDDQARVLANVATLVENVDSALPALMAHLGDERYCLTMRSKGDGHYSVGNVCRFIFDENVKAGYYDALPGRLFQEAWKVNWRGPSRSKVERSEWLRGARNKHLYELQIERAEWAKTQLHKIEDRAALREDALAAREKIDANIAQLQSTKVPMIATYDRCFRFTSIYTNHGRETVHNVLPLK